MPTVIPVCVSRCASGFYGNPQVVGGACVRCECHGNVNISEAGYCDIITGECLRCLGNTAGRHCEVCQPGYYGDAVHTKNCQGETHTYTHTSNLTSLLGVGSSVFFSQATGPVLKESLRSYPQDTIHWLIQSMPRQRLLGVHTGMRRLNTPLAVIKIIHVGSACNFIFLL